MITSSIEGLIALPPDASRADIRHALVEHGYAYLPQQLPPEKISGLVADIHRVMARQKWTPASDWAASFPELYAELQALPSLHEAADDDRLHALAGAVLGEDIFRLPDTPLRVAQPRAGRAWATAPHQDFIALQVAVDVVTAWVALTPCRLGEGLLLIPGSHLNGYRPPDPTVSGARPLYISVDDASPWAGAEYEPGDVVLFHSLTVHGGRPDPTGTRLSFDSRFQSVHDPVLRDHVRPHGWPEVPDWSTLSADWPAQVPVPCVPPSVCVLPEIAGRFEETLIDLTPPVSRLLPDPSSLRS